MASPPAAAGRELQSLNPHIWRAFAGTAVKIPTVGSTVYYYPQGHAEQSSSQPDFSSISITKSFFSCRVASVTLLANTDSEEVFAKIVLNPLVSTEEILNQFRPSPSPATSSLEDTDPNDGDGGVTAFSKILTPSDANGGVFTVPRFCADSFYPPINFNANPSPVQTLSIRDLHGTDWTFWHKYRRKLPQHRLTTGWSKFVNAKKLVAGDSIVFIKDRTGQLFVGVRRAVRSCGLVTNHGGSVGKGKGFSRNVRGRVLADSVVEAVRLAHLDRPFEVEYYPNAGSPEFVVGAEMVEAAMRMPWKDGLRIKMPVETGDSLRVTWYHGVVSISTLPKGAWAGSPWRMLEVVNFI